MPEEPLIFVEVALVKGMSGDIQGLLDETAPLGDAKAADGAIFYSISNCQRGLVGISFGDFLIKRVVDALARELPASEDFSRPCRRCPGSAPGSPAKPSRAGCCYRQRHEPCRPSPNPTTASLRPTANC